MGAGAYALLGAKLSQGIDVILDMMKFEELARGCKAIFTGGKDGSTVRAWAGKWSSE